MSGNEDIKEHIIEGHNFVIMAGVIIGVLVVWPGTLVPNSRGNKAAENLRLIMTHVTISYNVVTMMQKLLMKQ